MGSRARAMTRARWVSDTFRERVLFPRRHAISGSELVLDVGSGPNPLLRANVLCEKFIEDGRERHGGGVVSDVPLVIGDVERLPFATGAFDFVACEHVLEHVVDPAAAVAELTRVARRGYVETPSASWEKVAGFPFHRWLVSVDDGVLTFRHKRAPIEDPALQAWFAELTSRLGIWERLWFSRRRIGTYTCVWWDRELEVAVEREEPSQAGAGFDNATLSEPGDEPGVVALTHGERLLRRWGRFLRRHSQISAEEVARLLRCPGCRSGLVQEAAWARCSGCDLCFPRDASGRPRLLLELARAS